MYAYLEKNSATCHNVTNQNIILFCGTLNVYQAWPVRHFAHL